MQLKSELRFSFPFSYRVINCTNFYNILHCKHSEADFIRGYFELRLNEKESYDDDDDDDHVCLWCVNLCQFICANSSFFVMMFCTHWLVSKNVCIWGQRPNANEYELRILKVKPERESERFRKAKTNVCVDYILIECADTSARINVAHRECVFILRKSNNNSIQEQKRKKEWNHIKKSKHHMKNENVLSTHLSKRKINTLLRPVKTLNLNVFACFYFFSLRFFFCHQQLRVFFFVLFILDMFIYGLEFIIHSMNQP